MTINKIKLCLTFFRRNIRVSEVIHNDLINTTTCFLARKLYKSIIQYKHVVKKHIIMHVCRATVLPRKICYAIKK